MKQTFYIILLLVGCPNLVSSQVLDLTNVKREIPPNKYDSTYCFIPGNLEQEDHAGYVGEEIVLLEHPTFNTDKLSNQLIGKTLLITEYIPGDHSYEDAFKLTYESKEYIISLNNLHSNISYLSGGLEKMKKVLIGQKFSLKNRYSDEINIQGFDGKRYNRNETYQVKDVQIAKIGEYKYSPVVIFEDGLILKVDENLYEGHSFMDNDNNSFEIIRVDESQNELNVFREYDDSGDGVYGRRVIYRNLKGLFSSKIASGKTTIKICINRQGVVEHAEVLKSTISDQKHLNTLLEAAKGYKYEPDPSAPREQCGKLTIDLDMQALRGG